MKLDVIPTIEMDEEEVYIFIILGINEQFIIIYKRKTRIWRKEKSSELRVFR